MLEQVRSELREIVSAPRKGGVPPILDSFYGGVSPEPNTGCWIWTRGACGAGYGRVAASSLPATQNYAHRLSYILHIADIPTGFHVCHQCDHPWCVNPAHLFAAPPTANYRDMIRKWRAEFQRSSDRNARFLRSVRRLRGEEASRSKLTNREARAVKYLLQQGVLQIDLARAFGVHKATIGSIANNRTWSWL